MKVIDANTGAEVVVGQTFDNVNGRNTLLDLDVGLTRGRGLFRITPWEEVEVTEPEPGGRRVIRGSWAPGPGGVVQFGPAETTTYFKRVGLRHHETRQMWVPLQIRYTHPSFFLQKIAFIPS